MKTKSNYVVQVITLLLGVLTLAVVSSCGEKQENGHGYVDLGLPSGTMWATCNVCASDPNKYGDYFPWEDIHEAQKQWGGKWRIPTKSEMEELFNFCEVEKKTEGNIIGISLKGPNGNSIFIPCAGFKSTDEESVEGLGKYVRMWTDKQTITSGQVARGGYTTFSDLPTGYCGKLIINDDGTIKKKTDVSDDIFNYIIYKYLNSLRLVFTQETK
jgi:hypothetical protein